MQDPWFDEQQFFLQKKRFVLRTVIYVCIFVCLFAFLLGGALLFDSSVYKEEPAEPFVDPFLKETVENYEDEIRGVYIASVYNLNFPSGREKSAEELKSELDHIIKECESTGFNTIYFQVRPSADALYESQVFPTSRFIVKNEGDKLPMDPLAYLVEKAGEKDIDVVAWVNPYRISSAKFEDKKSALADLSDENPAKKNPDWTLFYDGKLYFDPGVPEVRKLVVEGVKELCSSYKIAGVLYDDYFYPYPVENGVLDDTASYEKSNTTLSVEDWRRQNVNLMVEESYKAVKAVSGEMTFGVSPFGIWKNAVNDPEGSQTSGMEAYSALYCDALAWVKGGYIDYVSPQLYWDRENTVASFEVLADWWNSKLIGSSVKLVISHSAYKAGEFSEGGEEIALQIKEARKHTSSAGSIQYGFEDIQKNSSGVKDALFQVFSATESGKEAE